MYRLRLVPSIVFVLSPDVREWLTANLLKGTLNTSQMLFWGTFCYKTAESYPHLNQCWLRKAADKIAFLSDSI